MNEMVILESPAMRQQLCTDKNVTILDKVGELISLPETEWTTKENIASFYQVATNTIDQVIHRHKQELTVDGYKVLSKKDFENLHDVSFKIPNRGLAVFSRRAALRIGMLLQNSVVAKLIRSYLLNVEENLGCSPQTQQKLNFMVMQLDKHADQLIANASQLSSQADELKDHAQQLRLQTNMVKAIVGEIYVNRDHIKKVDSKAQSNTRRIAMLEKLTEDSPQYITSEQIKTLREKVKQRGNPATIWAKFRVHFNVSRYVHLPRHRFEEAVDWITKLQPSF